MPNYFKPLFIIWLFISGYFSSSPLVTAKFKDNSFRVPILMYHHLGVNPEPKNTLRQRLTVSQENFQQQLQFLAEQKYTPISFQDYAEILNGKMATPTKPIILTFDDGYYDFYSVGYQELKKFNFKATAFVISGYLGAPDYLKPEQLKEMNNSGLIEIAGHTVNHPDLTKIKLSEVNQQLKKCKADLEKLINWPVNYFAYPYGKSNSQIELLTKTSGYLAAAGTHYGYSTKLNFNLPRVRVSGDESLASFKKELINNQLNTKN